METSPDRKSVRELPKNIEAEQTVLGAAIMEPENVVPVLVELLRPEDFYERRHRVIFRAMRDLFEDHGRPCDIILLANHLDDAGNMERAGGRLYLNELLDRTTTTASLEYYADLVRQKAKLRAMIEAGGRISEMGFDQTRDPSELLDRAEGILFDITGHDSTSTYSLIGDTLYAELERLENIARHPGTVSGFATGFPALDGMINGLQRGDLNIIASRPSIGKTALLVSMAREMVIRNGLTVAFFSIEMSREQITDRLLAAEAHVDLHRLRGGHVDVTKWRDVAHAASKIKEARLIIDDDVNASVLDIRARARRIASQYPLDVVMVDYLQIVDPGRTAERREQDVAHISRSLKRLARELNVSVAATSQLNRNPEGREDKRPRLADLRESGAIEQDADVVMFIYRDKQDGDDKPDAPRFTMSTDAELIIAKQRNGPIGTVDMTWQSAYASFYPQAKGSPES